MLYSTLPGLVLGFHGCDETVANQVLEGTSQLRKSENVYDWLGHGIYFWENNPERALQYAKDGLRGRRGTSSRIETPFAIGAVIDLGHCLNLLDSTALSEVKEAYNLLAKSIEAVGGEMPRNENPPEGNDSLRRNLDCAAFEMLHQIREASDSPPTIPFEAFSGKGKNSIPAPL